MAQFAVGDYVLHADTWGRNRFKLSLWCGPAVVYSTPSNWIFEVGYWWSVGSSCQPTQILFWQFIDCHWRALLQIVHNSEGYVFNNLLDCRFSLEKKAMWNTGKLARTLWIRWLFGGRYHFISTCVIIGSAFRAFVAEDDPTTEMARSLGIITPYQKL